MTDTSVKTYSLAEVAKHNSNQSTWIIIHNNIYDLTTFLNEVRVKYLKKIVLFDFALS